ncbi:MAG: DUF4382 domain-containing protein [Balneolaceae bacterium]|nr:DUF4382 domain-containing protein [Balneolaceae bacterium]
MFSRIIITLTSILFLLTSCDIANETGTETDNGTLRVLLTDAPADYDAVWIDIQEVRVHLNDDEEIEEDNDGWITVSNDPIRVNLLDLTNGELEVLGETDLEAGMYSQIRLILGDDNEIVKDGVIHALDTPSAQQSGLKININADIEEDVVYTLLLDFDASRSIVEAGNSGKFILKPVIRTVALAETGAIEGSIEPAEALPWVYAIAEDDTLAGTKADVEGDFRLIGLLPGSYTVSINPTEGDYLNKELTGVEVLASDTTDVGITVLTSE